MPDFDDLAADYDETRGGERRGDEYAADVSAHLPPGEGPVLEIGVGTGVVALGLRRRGYDVVGLDVSAPMLTRGRERLGPSVVLSDAQQMAVRSGSVAHAVSVWVLQSVPDPVRAVHEAARVIRPGGRYVVCLTQVPDPDDAVGRIVSEMGARIDARRGVARSRVSAEQLSAWGRQAGFTSTVHRLERTWTSNRHQELDTIRLRIWPALRALDEAGIEEVTRPAVTALEALGDADIVRRASADLVVLEGG